VTVGGFLPMGEMPVEWGTFSAGIHADSQMWDLGIILSS